VFISVVVPAYNEERYLPACLEALQNQTLRPEDYEVIVVDNTSTDATAAIARRHGARVVWEPVKGFATARQRGFEEARGEIIASTDADTVVPPLWLERIAGHFARNPKLGGVCGPVHWRDGLPHEQWSMKYPVTWTMVISHRLGRGWWIGSNFAVRAHAFGQVNGFRDFSRGEAAGEDLYLARRVRQVAPLAFDRSLVVYSSSRRTREGYLAYLHRTSINARQILAGRRPALPPPDIR